MKYLIVYKVRGDSEIYNHIFEKNIKLKLDLNEVIESIKKDWGRLDGNRVVILNIMDCIK